MNKIKKAIIPVAGNGTRFLPFTKTIPKEMLPILNRPTIDLIVDEAIASGIEEIIFIVSPEKKALVDFYKRNYSLENTLKVKGKDNLVDLISSPVNKVNFIWIFQEEALGLGHAVSLASHLFEEDETFALLLGDDVIYYDDIKHKPALAELIETYNETNMSVLGVQEVPKEKVSSYGVVSIKDKINDESWIVSSVVEKPSVENSPSNLAIVGRYLLNSKIFDYLSEGNVDSVTGEIQITDSIMRLIDDSGVTARNLTGTRYDMGSTIGFIKAQIEFGLKDPNTKDELTKIMKDNI